MDNGDGADDEGNEWTVSQLYFSMEFRCLSPDCLHFQLIKGTKNKGTITRSTDFGRTPISDIFRGELRSRLQREGDHTTCAMQPFFTLQLNIEVCYHIRFGSFKTFIEIVLLACLESKFGEGGTRKFRK